MKKKVRGILAYILLAVMLLVQSCPVSAATKKQVTRAIAIVFDNSGSMYMNGEQAWCRATYAMEVFASMLNEGDELLIYPMHPIRLGSAEYTDEAPLGIDDPKQASRIREIYTLFPGATPIESIDAAAQGLLRTHTDEKWLIVLTDGQLFHENDQELSLEGTEAALTSRFSQ